MEDIINIGTFIQHLTYFIKIGIYINKGTDKDVILEKCIKLYNKYKTIEANATAQITEEDETFVRRCLKRLNLVLKIDDNDEPVDIRKKENQLLMIFLEGHPSLANNDMTSMVNYANQNNITIMTDIPLTFILRESKYQELLWQYTRSLFYISQILISKVDPDADSTNKSVRQKNKILNDSMENLESILETISETEEQIKLNQVMALDKFLNTNLVKTGINEKNVNEAKNEVKEIFAKKGLGVNNSMTKMIDLISNEITSVDLTKGNIIQNMFSIAQSVAQEMKPDLENNPDQFQNTLGAITEVFQEAMNDSSKNGDEVPSEIKNMFNTIISNSSMINDGKEPTEEEITKSLEGIIDANGLNREDFYNSIKDGNGEIDVSKLENFLSGLQID